MLEEINLADNLLTKIENIDSLSYLHYINFSGNKIEEFSKINNLKCLKRLKILKLNDENFWPNRVCEIEGYFEYILMLLPNLQVKQILYRF